MCIILSVYFSVLGNKGINSVAKIKTSHIALLIRDKLFIRLIRLDVYSFTTSYTKDVFEKVAEVFDSINNQDKFLNQQEEFLEIN